MPGAEAGGECLPSAAELDAIRALWRGTPTEPSSYPGSGSCRTPPSGAPVRSPGKPTQDSGRLAACRGEFDLVQSAIKDKNGNPIFVSTKVDLKTGKPQPGSPLQEVVPEAVSFKRREIVDDKPSGRPLAKDRQEIIRFIEACRRREGLGAGLTHLEVVNLLEFTESRCPKSDYF